MSQAPEAPARNSPDASPHSELATVGGGCFWCLEAVFQPLRGVLSVTSGYAGGDGSPTYDAVCGGQTGHAEAVQAQFDPAVISYRDLLEIFFALHDPTTLNRQGNDRGTQYRSVIFTHSAAQAETAHDVIRQLTQDGVFSAPIVTQVVPEAPFFPAEAYHQDYFARNPRQSYCVAVISPKVAKLRQKFSDRLRTAE